QRRWGRGFNFSASQFPATAPTVTGEKKIFSFNTRNSNKIRGIKRMTESGAAVSPPVKSGRGGRRDGAGRKNKIVDPTLLDQATVDILIADAPSEQVEQPAQRHARTAVLALVKKLLAGGCESARVTAANSILDRGYGKPSVDIGGDAMPTLFSLRPEEKAAAGLDVVPIEVRTEARKYAGLAI